LTLRRLDAAFQGFFRRIKAGQKPGYPRFRSINRFESVHFTANHDGWTWNAAPNLRHAHVRFKGVGHVKVIQHRPVLGRIKQGWVKRHGRKWFIFISCDDVPPTPLPATGSVIGLDMAAGDNGFAYTSDRDRIDNPRYLHVASENICAANRVVTRRRKGSNRRRKAAQRLGEVHSKVARQRRDFAHKTALELVRKNDFIAVEALLIPNMVRKAAPKPDPDMPGHFLPNGGSAKSALTKSILDAGWGGFLDILQAKAESAGRVVVKVNPTNTSRKCARCGNIDSENRHGKAFKCLACGHADDADFNAAENILRAGLALRGP
jgi:putative transposase